jgi:hypothetical protein
MHNVKKKIALNAFLTLINIDSILEINQKKIATSFENAEENWILLKMHILQGWKKLARSENNKHKKGFGVLFKILKGNDRD